MANLVSVVLKNGIAEFSLSNRPEIRFLCDEEDLCIMSCGKFYVHISTSSKNPYIRKNIGLIKRRHIHFHRLVIRQGDYSKDSLVDHINRDTKDNRKYNLRVVGIRGNIMNSASRGNVKISYIPKRGLYQAYIGRKYIACSKSRKGLDEKLVNKGLGK